MSGLFGIILLIISVLTEALIIFGITLHIFKRKRASQKNIFCECVAEVANKQFFYKRIASKNGVSRNEPQYIVTFISDNNAIHLNTPPELFDSFKPKQSGLLKYSGSTFISFEEL